MKISYRYLNQVAAQSELEELDLSVFSVNESVSKTNYHLRPFTDSGITNSRLEEIRQNVIDLLGGEPNSASAPKMRGVEFDRLFIRNCLEIFYDLDAVDGLSPEVWSYITLRVLPDIAFWRWPDNAIERYIENPERGAFQRLWHRSTILGPELASKLMEDEAISIFERMEAVGSNRDLARELAKQIVAYREARLKGMPGSSDLLSQVCKRTRRSMSVIEIHALNQNELADFVTNIMDEATLSFSEA
jgi:hypothetical protein